jgi:hypothetical protein
MGKFSAFNFPSCNANIDSFLCGTSCRVCIQYCETLSKKDCQLGTVPSSQNLNKCRADGKILSLKKQSLRLFLPFFYALDDDDEWLGEIGRRERENLHKTTR